MTTALLLTEEYIFARDLRPATAKIYQSSAKAMLAHFGATPIEQIDHRSILSWRKEFLANGKARRSWNTYSSHLRTVWKYAIKHEMLKHTTVNPFKETCVTPPKRPSKILDANLIQRSRSWLDGLEAQERCTNERSQVTPAWFWLAVFEVFYYTGIRLNALLHLRYKDVDLDKQMILIRGETEKTHREFSVPIMEGLAHHLKLIMDKAKRAGFTPDDQLFNVNRFSMHYRGRVMTSDQVEAMYRKLTQKFGARITPHRFRHTLATDLMKEPDRNIHLTKNLLNHSNIATTMSYVEVDYSHMRTVLHERSVMQGALKRIRREDSSGASTRSHGTVRRLDRPTVKLPSSKALEEIAIAMELSTNPALKQALNHVANYFGEIQEPQSDQEHPPVEMNTLAALMSSAIRRPSMASGYSIAQLARPTKLSP